MISDTDRFKDGTDYACLSKSLSLKETVILWYHLFMDIFQAYEILGLQYGAPPSLVKSTYHRLCRELHPDTPGTTEADHERYLQVVSAYELIIRSVTAVSSVQQGRVIGKPVVNMPNAGGRVLGKSSVSVHPGTAESLENRRKFEKQMQQSRDERRSKEAAELKQRQKELAKQREKEKQILNEIRMIRLAHIIHETLAVDMKKKEG